MLVNDVMSRDVISVSPDESVAVAARLLSRYNVGLLPVCTPQQKLQGVLTDRDIVLRCVATGSDPARERVRHIMTGRIVSVGADEPAAAASAKMAKEQVRRLPVEQNGRLVGMVSLADLAQRPDYAGAAAQTLREICSNVHEL